MKQLLYIIILLFALSGCKKYPEGGRINTLAGIEDRVAGPYSVQQLKTNDVDTSFSGNPNLCPSNSFPFSFVKNQFDGKILTSTCGTFPTSSWRATADRKQLVITYFYTSSATELYPLVINQDITVTWDIQRLTKDHLWIKTTLHGKVYFLKLHYFH